MVNVAILGYGTVGSGVGEIFYKNGQHISQRVANEVNLKYILDLREFPGDPYADRVIHDFSIIENDPEVAVVVETMGGVGFAYDCTKRALSKGKSVVTSNKELVATHGYELLQLAKANGCSYLFEASVGGGIPILRPMSNCLAANELQEIVGILNGTTNYILTRMIRAGLSFDAALKEAQDNGYAEKDPTADIEGHDACRKICILSSLGYGRHIYPEQVPTEGISNITLSDVAYARSGGYRIKLFGRSIRRESDGKVCAYVAPHLVDEESPLANVEDVFNAILVTGDSIGDVMFYGRGAGKMPTASAVVADVMDIVRAKGKKLITWEEGGSDTTYSVDEVASRWYLRVAGDLFVEGTKRLRNGDAKDGESAFITDEAMTPPQLRAWAKGLEIRALYRVL
ncbi:MAG: homoserine dehydrogenase [Clostridiales bacterium]|nr:homoserine dehydrogenase [Clostridiales bacterium]